MPSFLQWLLQFWNWNGRDPDIVEDAAIPVIVASSCPRDRYFYCYSSCIRWRITKNPWTIWLQWIDGPSCCLLVKKKVRVLEKNHKISLNNSVWCECLEATTHMYLKQARRCNVLWILLRVRAQSRRIFSRTYTRCPASNDHQELGEVTYFQQSYSWC